MSPSWRGEAGFLADEIFRRRQFHVRRIAFKGRYRQSRPFGERRIVGEIAAAVARGAAMGIENHVEAKRLRRLRDSQPRALGRRLDIAGLADLLDGVGDRDRRHRRAGAAGGIDRARNHRRRDEGPRGVVDQNDVGLLGRQRLEPGMHRGLARRAAIGRAAGGAVPRRPALNIAVSSGFTTGCTANTSGCRQNASMARKITVCPPISRYCLGPPAPARSPRPAATRMAAVRSGLGIGTQIQDGSGLRRVGRGAQPLPCRMRENRAIPDHLWEKQFLLQCTCTNDRTV